MDNFDVVILEKSVNVEETPVASNGFTIAPPTICEKWVRPSRQSLNNSIIIDTYHHRSKGCDLVPLFAMASEPTLKISEVKSLSPLKNNRSSRPVQCKSAERKRKLQHPSPAECITLDDDCDDEKSPSALRKKLKLENSPKQVSFNEQVHSSDNARNESEDCVALNNMSDMERNVKNGKDPNVQPPKRVKLTTLSRGKMSTTIEDFIKVCTEVGHEAGDVEDMKRILNNKVLKHYDIADKVFTASQSFQKMLERLIANVKNDISNMYVPIAELVAELKARKASNNEPPKKKQKHESDVEIDSDIINDNDQRTQQKISKLSRTLSLLKTVIKELEERELGLDELDKEDSAYIMLQRYKERALKVFQKLCEYTKESKSAGRSNKIQFSGTPFHEVNKCIRAFVNETGEFPDYVDILNVIKKVNSETRLITSEEELKIMARKAFTEVGEELQKNRKLGVAESLYTFISNDTSDPADESEELQSQLKANKANWLKLNEIIDDFATRETKPKEAANEDEEEEEEEEEDEEDEVMSDLNISDTETVDTPEIENQRKGEIDKEENDRGSYVTEIQDLTAVLGTEVSESEVQGGTIEGTEEDHSKTCLVSTDLAESTAEGVENTLIKSEPSDGNIFKIRVRSAESLGGLNFSNLKESSNQVSRSDSDDVILLD